MTLARDVIRKYRVAPSGNVYARAKWSKWWLVTLWNSSFSQPWTMLQCGRITQSRSPSRFADFDSVFHSLLKSICIHFAEGKGTTFYICFFFFFFFLIFLFIVNNRLFFSFANRRSRMFDLEISTFKNRKCFSFVLFSKIGIYMLFLNWSSSTVPFISSFQSSHRPFSPIVWTFKSESRCEFKSRPLRCSRITFEIRVAYASSSREAGFHPRRFKRLERAK